MPSSPATRVVAFRVGDVTAALPAEIVLEIAPSAEPTRIPGVEAAVVGIVNIRGSLLTLLDAHLILGRPATGTDRSILVVGLAGRRAALLVGAVGAVVQFDATLLRDEVIAGVPAAMVQGVAGEGDDRMLVLDAGAVFAPVLDGRNTGAAASAAAAEPRERSGGNG